MKKIKNEAVLLQHGVKESRKIVLDILDETLCELDSYKRIRSMVSLKGSVLTIGNQKWDLNKKDNVYVFADTTHYPKDVTFEKCYICIIYKCTPFFKCFRKNI